jgi:hypothetical protein
MRHSFVAVIQRRLGGSYRPGDDCDRCRWRERFAQIAAAQLLPAGVGCPALLRFPLHLSAPYPQPVQSQRRAHSFRHQRHPASCSEICRKPVLPVEWVSDHDPAGDGERVSRTSASRRLLFTQDCADLASVLWLLSHRSSYRCSCSAHASFRSCGCGICFFQRQLARRIRGNNDRRPEHSLERQHRRTVLRGVAVTHEVLQSAEIDLCLRKRTRRGLCDFSLAWSTRPIF